MASNVDAYDEGEDPTAEITFSTGANDIGLTDEELRGEGLPWHDHAWALTLFACAACVRMYDIGHPAGVVFDEHHYGRFVNRYFAGKFFFDSHPPLAKLTLFAVASATDYNPSACLYEWVSQEYPSNCNYVSLRLCSGALGLAVLFLSVI